ncbi:phage tail protein [Sphingomonas sp. R-74633]|uniref:phage tail protein n=1 Tax=Sphingomonas sp. R-74633 TaxID=2751188 RepID=UPI0015D3C174|nr:tail fiber protein [Sphingomonas sp. R-74633]NYT40307.1 phage tail protein [Sphingomonas sp. R-74633]
MAEPFMGEIRLMSFTFAPKNWAQCNGQFLPINQNQALFSLLGTTFGGNGQTTFALPDLRGRVPIHVGNGYTLGQRGGEEAHTLSISELPTHVHRLQASNANGNAVNPNFGGTGYVLAAEPGNAYATGFTPAAVALNAGTVASNGGSQAHQNMQPFLTLGYCIAVAGIFPSPN